MMTNQDLSGIDLATLQAEIERRTYKPQQINTPTELALFARQHGLLTDWHEPDEQDIDARIRGGHLDNAMGTTLDDIGENNFAGEYQVILTEHTHKYVYEDGVEKRVLGKDLAVINLATLLSWAAQKGEADLIRGRTISDAR